MLRATQGVTKLQLMGCSLQHGQSPRLDFCSIGESLLHTFMGARTNECHDVLDKNETNADAELFGYLRREWSMRLPHIWRPDSYAILQGSVRVRTGRFYPAIK